MPAPATSFIANVKDYGARGNGQTDDTVAIQKAIDAVAAKGGGIVDVPAGTYLIDAMRQVSSYYETSGLILKSNVILRMTDRTVLRELANGSQFASVIAISDATNAHILGGIIEGDRDRHTDEYGEWAHGVRINNSNNVVIEKVTSRNNWGDGFYIGKRATSNTATENITFHQVRAEHNRRQGLSITYGKNIKVLKSVFKDTDGTDPRAGIDIEPNLNEQVSNVEVRGNIFTGNRYGLVASNHMHGGSTSIKGVFFESNMVADNHVGILYVGVVGGSIRNNKVYQKHDMPKDYPYHHQYGIELRNGAVQDVTGINVRENTIYGGNVIDRYTSGNTITNNYFKTAVYLFGTAQPGQTITAEVYDGDYGEPRRHMSVQVPPQSVSSYRWLANGVEIPGATGPSYTLTNNERGKKITVQVAYKDNTGQAESATSEASAPVGYQNHAPINITVNPLVIYGNEDQAEVGVMKAIDVDAVDGHTYRVSDSRFEINGDMLRLKKGQRLDYSKVNSVNFTITATDKMGASFSKQFTAYVRAPRGAPAFEFGDFTIDNRTVKENQPGAVVGRLNLNDRDIGKTHKYYVVDKRFELVNGTTLKLKDGQKLDYETEPLARVHIIASNSGGRSIMKEFVLQVLDDPNEKVAGVAVSASKDADGKTTVKNVALNGEDTNRGSAPLHVNDGTISSESNKQSEAKGLRVDLTARYYSSDELQRLVDAVKAGGGQYLQLRLSSDDSYALESELLGQSTANSQRNADGSYSNGLGQKFYGRDQLGALANYAKRQDVELIAEVDFPGQARAVYQLLKAKDPQRAAQLFQRNGQPHDVAAAGEFVRGIYGEVINVLPNGKHFHMGGGEFAGQRENNGAFLKFVSENGQFLKGRGLQPQLWNDGIYRDNLQSLDKSVEVEVRSSGDGRASVSELKESGFKVRDFDRSQLKLPEDQR